MSLHKICIIGGSGFVGHALAGALSSAGHRVTVISRHRERHRDLLVLPTVQVVEGNPYNLALLLHVFKECDTVINLVGILNERGHNGKGFEFAHVNLAARILEACKQTGVRRLLHMSALNAEETAPSHYLRSKARAEQLVHHSDIDQFAVTSFRPSVIFGRGDSFINRFAGLLRLAPGVFPLACANARFQPIYVGDVVRAFVESLDNHRTYGRSLSLCGPQVMTLKEIVVAIARHLGLSCRVFGLPDSLSLLQALVLEYTPFIDKPFSLDNYHSLKVDSVCANGSSPELNWPLTRLGEALPEILGSSR